MCKGERNVTNINEKLVLQSVIKEREYYHCFQPIVHMQQQTIFGYESLLRSEHVANPESLFDVAFDLNKLLELDVSSFKMTVNAFINQHDEISKGKHLFVNVYPSTLLSSLFIDQLFNLIDQKVISPYQLILELSEAEQISHYSEMKKVIKQLREFGVKIALDDLGKGHCSLQKIVELEPNYVKFDQFFAKNLTMSTKKQCLLKSLLNYCKANNIETILEGIETKNDLDVARSLGIQFGQGYFLGKPKRIIL